MCGCDKHVTPDLAYSMHPRFECFSGRKFCVILEQIFYSKNNNPSLLFMFGFIFICLVMYYALGMLSEKAFRKLFIMIALSM